MVIKNQAKIYAGWEVLYAAGAEENWSERPPPWFNESRAKISPGSKVLELCAGDGRITQELVATGHAVTALDIAPSALKAIQTNFQRRGLPHPLLVRGSATDIPLGDAQFDVIICVNGIGQLDRPAACIKEAARVLRPGGWFIFDVFTPDDETFGEGEQIGAQDFLYRGTLFRYFTANQFAPIYEAEFELVEMKEEEWMDPAHGEFRPVSHVHRALVYTLKKKG
jgi:ubiquinone/menaquinone biosynthesis C-methylase UbiE